MRLTLAVSKETGRAGILYNDSIPASLLKTSEDIQRISSIEFCRERGCWQIRPMDNLSEVLFEHEKRNACIEWEHAHARELLLRVLCQKKEA